MAYVRDLSDHNYRPLYLIIICLIVIAAMLYSPLLWAASSPVVKQPHVNVSLLSVSDAVSPGRQTFVGLYLQPDPHWHVYWQNPGDSGLAPTLQWAAQPEVSFGEIQWPFPEPIPVEHLMNYGYNGDVLLPIPVTVAENYSGSHITFKANARWLVCKVECVPGKADLSLTLPVKPNGAAAGAQQALFEQAFNKVPQSLSLQGAPVQFSDNQVSLQLYAKTPLFKDVKHVQFFPITGNLVEYANPATLQWHNNLLKITQATSLEFTGAPESIKGVIVIDNAQAWQFSIAVE